jgi:hypothetical protein
MKILKGEKPADLPVPAPTKPEISDSGVSWQTAEILLRVC